MSHREQSWSGLVKHHVSGYYPAGTVHNVSNVGIAEEQISNILHVHDTVQYSLKIIKGKQEL